MHAVECNDDLLIEILLRLPVFSLLLFKSVCKRWLSLIINPSFGLRRIPTFDPPCGLLLRAWFGKTYDFLSLDTRSPYKQSALKTPFTFRSELQHVDILQSSNGLLLCRGGIKNNYKYYVYNPCMNLFKMLPQCSNKIIRHTKIAFDPTKSPHYKVIQTVLVKNDYETVLVNDDDGYDALSKIQIQTYSSETRNWNFCSDQHLIISFRYFDYGIYWNDAIYWLYNSLKPNVISMLDIKVEHQPSTIINTLGLLDCKVSSTYDSMLFESRGCLLLLILCDYQCSRRINVYETRNGLSGLSIKYSVNLGDITRPFPRDYRFGRIRSGFVFVN
ncbi:F-box protein-like protein isoform X1 [Tanacetum coccineum]